ncbi:MAG TPA: succinate--CoA ligase subunit alpha, partial [Actinophytocola sp.]|nr:succinate--CoA ligase subunit alpha [Actinophytocola sp.]
MAIFLNEDSRIIVQGMTGAEGTKHTHRMLAAGSTVVGGVTPGKGGREVEVGGVTLPVFDTVGTAIEETGA